jgi:hypothetical protein
MSALTDPPPPRLCAGGDIIETAKALLSVPHSGERLEHVWHVTGVFTVPELKKAIKLALQEYLLSEDVAEAVRCVKELSVPHYHHEVVYRLVVLTLEAMPGSPSAAAAASFAAGKGPVAKALALLVALRQAGVVTEAQIAKGFERARGALPDIKLDVPHAGPALDTLVHEAVEAGVLPARFAALLAALPAHEGGSAGGAGGAQSGPHVPGTVAGADTGRTGETPVGVAHPQHAGAGTV